MKIAAIRGRMTGHVGRRRRRKSWMRSRTKRKAGKRVPGDAELDRAWQAACEKRREARTHPLGHPARIDAMVAMAGFVDKVLAKRRR